MEIRITELEARVAKLEAAAGTAALIQQELNTLELRRNRIEKLITDQGERQRLLVALEVRCCSLRSLQQQL